MTTSPVMTITDELLAELKQKATDAIDENAKYGPDDTYDPVLGLTGIETVFACAANPATILALVEHIRRLTERLSYIERNFVGASFNWDDNGMCVLAIKIGDSVPVTRDFMAVIDAALAQQPAPVVVQGAAKLVRSAESLLAIDAAGKLAPHGISGLAREVIEGFIALAKAPAAQEPVAFVSEETFSSDGTSDIITRNLPVGTALYTAPPAAEQPGTVRIPRDTPAGIKIREILASISRQARNEACRHGMPRAGQACTFDGIADMADEALRTLLAGGDKP